ncbi:MAG: hypothetical protein AABY32_00970 [Nanoarchaeota archaeon]
MKDDKVITEDPLLPAPSVIMKKYSSKLSLEGYEEARILLSFLDREADNKMKEKFIKFLRDITIKYIEKWDIKEHVEQDYLDEISEITK